MIIGGGFAGVRVASDLISKPDSRLEVVLVSQSDAHVDYPLLYEVATAYLPRDSTMASEQITATAEVPLSQLFAGKQLRLIIKKVARLQIAQAHIVFDDDTTLDFDTLVIAVGTRLATFNISGVTEHAFSIKTLAESLRLRHHIVRQFYQAKSLKRMERASALTFVVVGGGASGVELAAELVGQVRHQAVRHGIDAKDSGVILLEAGPRILSMVPKEAARRVTARLEQLGVSVRVNAKITAVTPTGMTLQGGKQVYARTPIWTAGLRPSELVASSGLSIDRWGVVTNSDLTAQGAPNVLVVGDAAVISAITPPLPATVPVAYTQAATAARNIRRRLNGERLLVYRYDAPGMVVTLGGKKAMLLLPGGKYFIGYMPWLVKQFITLRYWSSVTTWRIAGSVWLRGWRLFGRND